MKTNTQLVRCMGILLGVFLLTVIPIDVLAQSLSEFESQLDQEAEVFKNIAKRLLEIIFIVGLIGVIYAYATKNQTAKEYLTYFIIALVLGGIGRAILF